MGQRTFVSTVAALALAAATSVVVSAGVLACDPQRCGGFDQAITVSVGDISATEGASVGPNIGIVVDTDPNATASQYTASISWGDGSAPSTATLMPTSPQGAAQAQFAILASHVYRDAGSYFIGVAVQDVDSRNHASGNGTAQIAEAPMTAAGVSDALINPYCDTVATIRDANAAALDSDLVAAIDWGDGTTSAGTLYLNQYGGPGTTYIAVSGCHTYGALGPHTVTTTASDGATQLSVTSTAWVYAMTDGGSFVVGDGNASIGGAVQFWGAGWANANTLSGGAAPDAFKGFAPGRSPICVGNWSARPGESATPPATVPAYTAVLVASSITKDEAKINGNSIHVVLVGTSADSGTGTVVYMIC